VGAPTLSLVTIERPPVPPPYGSPAPSGPQPGGTLDESLPADPAAAPAKARTEWVVPERLMPLANRHPLVIAAVIVSIVVTLATTVATLVAYAASSWWVFDILTSYRPQFAFVLAVGVVSLAVLRCWKTLIIAVIALGLNLAQVAPLYTSHQAAARPGSPTLTLAHLNLQSREGNIGAMRSWLETTPADVVVFLHSATGTADALRSGVGRYRMIYPEYLGLNDNGRSTYKPRSPEVIVLTDRAGVTADTPDFQELPSNSVVIETRLGNERIELLALHTVSPGTSQRHLIRDHELNAVAHWLATASRPAIAFGDFNTTYFSPAFRKALHDAHATTSQLGFGVQATWPHEFRPAGIAIDQSIYVGNITAVSRRRGPSLGSEHRALIVTYAFAKS
jgi:endonuclease/exonuclease/phosphatase (EEP) superfamily protein YafD